MTVDGANGAPTIASTPRRGRDDAAADRSRRRRGLVAATTPQNETVLAFEEFSQVRTGAASEAKRAKPAGRRRSGRRVGACDGSRGAADSDGAERECERSGERSEGRRARWLAAPRDEAQRERSGEQSESRRARWLARRRELRRRREANLKTARRSASKASRHDDAFFIDSTAKNVVEDMVCGFTATNALYCTVLSK